MLGGIQPVFDVGFKFLDGHASQGRGENCLKVMHRQLGHRFPVAGQHGLERFDSFEFRLSAARVETRSRQ